MSWATEEEPCRKLAVPDVIEHLAGREATRFGRGEALYDVELRGTQPWETLRAVKGCRKYVIFSSI
jgi:hypothetical protein